MKNQHAIAGLLSCFLVFSIAQGQSNEDYFEDYSKSEASRYSEKRSKFQDAVLPFLRNDKATVVRLNLEAAKSYSVKKAPITVANHLNDAALYSGNSAESLKLYSNAMDILLNAKVETRYDERERAWSLKRSASGAMVALRNSNGNSFPYQGDALASAQRFLKAAQLACEHPTVKLKGKGCDLAADDTYLVMLKATGDPTATAFQQQRDQSEQQRVQAFNALSTELGAARKANNHAAVVRVTGKILTEYKSALESHGFLRAIIALDRSRAFGKLNDAQQRDQEAAAATALIRSEPALTARDLQWSQQVATQYGLHDYAALLTNDIKAIEAAGDIQSDSAVFELGQSNAHSLREYAAAREMARNRVQAFQNQGAGLCAEWSRGKYEKYDKRYAEMVVDIAAEKERLRLETIEDRRRSAENWQALIAGLNEFSRAWNANVSGQESGAALGSTAQLSSDGPCATELDNAVRDAMAFNPHPDLQKRMLERHRRHVENPKEIGFPSHLGNEVEGLDFLRKSLPAARAKLQDSHPTARLLNQASYSALLLDICMLEWRISVVGSSPTKARPAAGSSTGQSPPSAGQDCRANNPYIPRNTCQ
jgi:hypothetical protein